MNIKRHIFFLLACLSVICTYSQDYSAIEFVENKGQWEKAILYKAEVPTGTVLIHKTGFTIIQHKPEDWNRLTEMIHGHSHDNEGGIIKLKPIGDLNKFVMNSHMYRVSFVGAANEVDVMPDKPLGAYTSYFIGNDQAKWATGCHSYQGITVKNLYPNIDIRYYSQNGRIKYDLIAHPGSDVSKIALKYEGVDKLEVKGKELNIKTSVGVLKELDPLTYQYDENGRKDIENRYQVSDNIVRFNIKKFNRKVPLIIDPTLIFCSLTGGTAQSWGFTATYGPDGSLYGGGIVFNNGFPTSPGAFQSSHSGGSGEASVDIGIIKLAPDGTTRLYATYIGGSGAEQPHSLVVDAEGNLVIAGRTNSTGSGGAAYPSTIKVGTGGGYDIVVTKLNTTGTRLIGSMIIGGSGDDGVNIRPSRTGPSSLQENYGDDGRSEVILDGAGNIYLASSTQSGNFPVTSGAFQRTRGGRDNDQDGVVLKLAPNLSSVLFASYLGGSRNDAAYVLALHPQSNKIYVAGGTESADFPTGQGGGLYPSFMGAIDGYVAIIDNSGAQLERATFLGTNAIDQVYGIQFDKFGFPYVMGQTKGTWTVTPNVKWSQPGGKQFISKLKQDLSGFEYSTTFGKGNSVPDISPVAFMVDKCENVYVSGWGGNVTEAYRSAGTSGLFVTPDALRRTSDGRDFYYLVLKRNSEAPLYATFHGKNGGNIPDHVDGGTSRFDRDGVIYQAMCADCDNQTGPSFPTTPGAWGRTNGARNCQLGMVKISFDFTGVRSGIQSSINGVVRDTTGCVPLTVQFRDTVQNAVSYEWNFGDGSPQITTTKPDTAHVYTAVGSYRVMLVAIDSASCNIRDTSYLSIKVGNNEAQIGFNFRKRVGTRCDVFEYDFFNLSTAPPGVPFTDSSFVWDFGDGSRQIKAGTQTQLHTYRFPGTYRVRLMLVDSNYCNAPAVIDTTIRIAANVRARFEVPPVGCIPFAARFINTSDAGQQFLWEFGNGATSTEVSPSYTYTIPGTYRVRLTAIDSSTCNISSVMEYTITVSGAPTADFSAAPQPPLVNTPITFTNLSSSDAVRFKWEFGGGDSLIVNSHQSVSHEYNTTGTYLACLIAYNASGCTDTVCKEVQALVDAAVDVPNAFTPGRGDANSILYVRGFGIGKMRFIIWNRWGEKVFETSDKRIGWDGKYKGVLQPMDVYAYTLEVEFTDGKKTSKKGDITLIR